VVFKSRTPGPSRVGGHRGPAGEPVAGYPHHRSDRREPGKDDDGGLKGRLLLVKKEKRSGFIMGGGFKWITEAPGPSGASVIERRGNRGSTP